MSSSSPPIGHNNPPADFETVTARIEDMFGEAQNFADGEPISSAEMAEALTKLYDDIHEAGKEAEAMRVAEKKPHDDAAKAVQDKYNPYVQAKKGKVDLAKSELGKLLAVWRAAELAKKEAAAKKAREDAAKAQAEAETAMRASSGNLEARVEAEEMLSHAKDTLRFAARSERAAVTGTGLRSLWSARLEDAEAALEWAYGREPDRFTELAQQIANEQVRKGVREIPGFAVEEQKVAA